MDIAVPFQSQTELYCFFSKKKIKQNNLCACFAADGTGHQVPPSQCVLTEEKIVQNVSTESSSLSLTVGSGLGVGCWQGKGCQLP